MIWLFVVGLVLVGTAVVALVCAAGARPDGIDRRARPRLRLVR